MDRFGFLAGLGGNGSLSDSHNSSKSRFSFLIEGSFDLFLRLRKDLIKI